MALRSLAVAVLAASLVVPGHAPLDEVTAPPEATTSITIETDAAAWRQRIDWAVDRFRSAGLSLPPMAVSVHAGTAPCNGESGRFSKRDPVEVHICQPGPSESRAARLITLHELAHAWAETQLTEADRTALLALRGLTAWIDARQPRHEWGAEHAAEVVSWGLMDGQIPIIRIYDSEPDALAVAFEQLVRRPPLWAT